MGGQNHQPCNRILTGASAWLSQKVGEGFIDVLAANNHLENAIMLGMNKLHVEDVALEIEGTVAEHVALTIDSLQKSLEALSLIPSGFQRLIKVAEQIGYKGNPHVGQLDSYNLEKSFQGSLIQPHVNKAVWDELHSHIKTHNILKTLEWESKQFESLVHTTKSLIAVMEESKEIAIREGEDAFVNAIENNEIPLRQYYAQVFSQWNNLHAMFLYSALIMTELFYRLNGYPSLTEFDPSSYQVVKAA